MKHQYLRSGFLIALLCVSVAITLLTANAKPDRGYLDDYDDGHKSFKKQTGVLIYAEPSDIAINPGGKAKYHVRVESLPPPVGLPETAVGVVYLTVSGIPPHAVGVFSPSMGLPTFESDLTVVTDGGVIPGIYKLKIAAFSLKRGLFAFAEVALVIQGGAVMVATTATYTGTVTTVTETSTTSSTPPTEGLNIVFSTDKTIYNKGEAVIIAGAITGSSQNAVTGAEVSVQVDNPLGSTYHVAHTTTTLQGFFNDTFTLSEDAVNGTYTVFVSAAYQGSSGSAQASFVVGSSNTPSISILNLEVKASGNQAAITPGVEVLAKVEVLNQGASLEGGMVWLEVDDPGNAPFYITMLTTNINSGETITVEFHILLGENVKTGLYTANAYVSNGYISQGGVFMDKESRAFIVESSSTVTTTTTTAQETETASSTTTTVIETTTETTMIEMNSTATSMTVTSETTTESSETSQTSETSTS
ncbi:MAG: MG2 domain-containing protein [Candidatus Bathyarchaeia archaeon]